MSSFKGSHDYSVDSKGRINIPARLRKYVSPEANDTFIVTRGYEKCLFVYPLDEWNKLEQSIRDLSPTNPQHRFFMRTLLELRRRDVRLGIDHLRHLMEESQAQGDLMANDYLRNMAQFAQVRQRVDRALGQYTSRAMGKA